jgi:hypothetical protein
MSATVTSIDRTHYRQLVADVAARAKEKLPLSVNGRIEAAAKLVTLGDVEPLADGTIRVNGSDSTRWYHLVGLTCTCKDFTDGQAPVDEASGQRWCKHRIAAGIDRRVREVLAAEASRTPPPAAPLPEAPASVNVRLTIAGRDCQLTLRDSDEVRLLARLAAVLQRYPAPQAPSPVHGNLHGPSEPEPEAQRWCPKHGDKMILNHKDGRSWWSHRLGDGTWCRGR